MSVHTILRGRPNAPILEFRGVRAACATVATGASNAIPAEPSRGCDITRRAWHDSYVPVLFLITIVVVLVGIFFAATGRGGEMAYEHADHAPLDLGPLSAADVALLRPPTALWGYNMQVTDEALDHIARAVRERDITIAYLQEQLAGRERDGSGAEPMGAHARPAPGSPEMPEVLPLPEPAEPAGFDEPTEIDKLTDILGTSPPAEDLRPEEAVEPAADTQPEEVLQAPRPPQTPLVLKASGAKAPPAPEPHEATQPSETLQDPGPDETTQPSETLQDPDPHETTQPSETLASHGHDAPGPQGAYDTHGWWAEQKEAARQEESLRQAAAEEQGW